MLDIQRIRDNPQAIKDAIARKKVIVDIDAILALDAQRRTIIIEVEKLKSRRNKASEAIAQLKKDKNDASTLIAEMKTVSDSIKVLDEKLNMLEQQIFELGKFIPNTPNEGVPHGQSSADNVVVSQWGEPTIHAFAALDHLAIGAKLDIIDFPRGAKIAGAGFPVLKGQGALLERALINFFLDTHVQKHGYTEIFPPFLVNSESAFGTGQLPKSADQMYHCTEDDLWAIPTAEVPVTNLYRDELLAEDRLPIKHCAYSACFRREAGSYGKDVKGYLRVHQFNKVELVKFTTPQTSYQELETLRADAEAILKALGLHYRAVMLCDADLSFAAAKCYDLETWAPVEKKWLEVSSCSNFENFQARRMNIRYRPAGGGKPELVHTLNGSGVATSRILVSLLETYQTEKGTVTVPEVLRPYMHGLAEIGAR
jgi:seryl-tRNA synthetase